LAEHATTPLAVLNLRVLKECDHVFSTTPVEHDRDLVRIIRMAEDLGAVRSVRLP
jgi:hypothetical protein